MTVQTESATDCMSEASSSSTSGIGSAAPPVVYTPPHSFEGSTPTHTEGTPSYTESSASGDAGIFRCMNYIEFSFISPLTVSFSSLSNTRCVQKVR
ncbi:hypothetical protein AVEN_122146-1 [Araneus ventricosus]|uniref:Uncharacterized protein n=1 Tax=Araneus ventricosus TaxID=182803 RepID=A0A4Y2I9J5_ARAVE|nr:hypothetical protein AVEN_122146-1 [Araneus ventricosus]